MSIFDYDGGTVESVGVLITLLEKELRMSGPHLPHTQGSRFTERVGRICRVTMRDYAELVAKGTTSSEILDTLREQIASRIAEFQLRTGTVVDWEGQFVPHDTPR